MPYQMRNINIKPESVILRGILYLPIEKYAKAHINYDDD